MMKRISIAAAALALVACSGGSSTQDSGTGGGSGGGGTGGGDDLATLFDVSGTAAVFPEGAALLADAGLPVTVAGLRLRVEEPFRIALNDNDPQGIFSSAILDAGGAFSASQVSTAFVTLGVAAGIRDDSDAGTPRVIRSATTLWDVALEGKKPDHNLTAQKGWAVPTLLHDKLTALVTPGEIMTITSGTQSTLIGAGFILGRIVDANGAPVAGLTLTPVSTVTGKFYYPNATLDGTGTATSSSGLFVYVHDGDMVKTFRVNVTNHTEYKTRQAGAAAAAGLVLTIYPGATAP